MYSWTQQPFLSQRLNINESWRERSDVKLSREVSLQRHLAVLQGSKQSCSSKQQNYHCGINLFTNKWNELHTFSVTPTLTAWGLAMRWLTGWSQTNLHHLNKTYLQVPVRIWNIFYCIFFILYYHYFMTLYCSLSLPVFLVAWSHLRSRTSARWPCGEHDALAPVFVRLSDAVAPMRIVSGLSDVAVPCLFIRSCHNVSRVSSKRPGLAYLWTKKDPLLLLFLLLSFPHASDLVGFSLVVLFFFWFLCYCLTSSSDNITRPSRPSVLQAAHWKQPADQTDLR